MIKRRISTAGPAILVDRTGAMPLYRQIYMRVRKVIAAGGLQPNARLPSARDLASELGTSRGTVEEAYSLLSSEGYIVRLGQGGSKVSPELVNETKLGQRLPRKRGEKEAAQKPKAKSLPQASHVVFQMGLPALDVFPRKLWSRLVARESRSLQGAKMAYPDPGGYLSLREAITRYLALSRGFSCAPEQVIVTSGYQGALDLICRVLLRPDDSVWFEDPGYLQARRSIAASGAELVPVSVDDEGVRVHDGERLRKTARLAIVTPSHQSPLCVTMSLSRRMALLKWAADHGSWIVEDDYDGEFHYSGRPLAALKSLDHRGRVLYAGSFSKTLFPALRLGYLVVPDALQEDFLMAAKLRDGGQSILMQTVVSHFIEDGGYARHLKKMRFLYATRREALADALHLVFGDRLDVQLQSGGMHLVAHLTGSARDTHISEIARASGYSIAALSAGTLRRPTKNALLLGFTNIHEDHAIQTCRKLEHVIGRLLG